MTYSHIGKVLENGIIAPEGQVAGPEELIVRPEDDGLHITDFRKGDFEWWYFDLFDPGNDCFLKVVFHIGTDPLKTKIYPQLAVSVTTPEGSVSFTRPYSLSGFEADTRQCRLKAGREVEIREEPGDMTEYSVKIEIPEFQCYLKFVPDIEGWKPLGNEVINRIGRKKGAFSWVVPMPGGKVNGAFRLREKSFSIRAATGYHDHNYIRVDPRHPLHLDSLITRWYWGKLHTGDLTVVFMDTRCRTNPLQSLMVAEKQSIIHSSNNRLECSIQATGEDPVLKVSYPSAVAIRSTDGEFPFRAELREEKLLDRRDLLEGVPGPVRAMIRKRVGRPAYHGIWGPAHLSLNDEVLSGWGNFESMVFRP